MPVNQVKTPEEEKLWERAKQQVSKQGITPSDPSYWKRVSSIFNKMKGNKGN
jgi:hypothetical protein